MRRMSFVWLLVAASAAMGETEPTPRQRRVRALEGMVESAGDDAIQNFAETHVAPALRDQLTPAGLTRRLRAIRAACAGFGGVLAAPAGKDGVRVTFLKEGGEASLVVRIDPEPPHLIVALDLQAGPPAAAKPVVPPLTWESLEQRLASAAKEGFAGTVLVVRAGQVVLHRGYGLADRETQAPVTTDTVFAIGSVPIDFTRAAILRLEQDGKLRTNDPLSTFVAGVPEDKRAITLDHLMTGRSGLPDFHHVEGKDEDPDLTWIDRAEALRRILGQDLLFPPGEGRAHSHSAWVMLAAVVELVAKQGYGDFLREHFFVPAGMTRTGLHEDAAAIEDREFAVGYGRQRVGAPNIPKRWGRTSWLVMGSGGMQSNPQDLYRWLEAIRSGKTLGLTAAARYWKAGVMVGGDDRGFYCLYTEGPGDLMILCSNTHTGPGDFASSIGRRLVELVMPRSR
ncbi:MAG TPA: serine hydrolase domain-containing protein [Vicinamibacteria bacterium]